MCFILCNLFKYTNFLIYDAGISNWIVLTKCSYNYENATILVSSTTKIADYMTCLCSKFKNQIIGSVELRYSFPNDQGKVFLTTDEDMYTMVVSAYYERIRFVNVHIVESSSSTSTSTSTSVTSSTNYSSTPLLLTNSSTIDLYKDYDDQEQEYMTLYKPKETPLLKSAIWKYYIQDVGQKFNGGVLEFREKLRQFAAESGFQFKTEKSDTKRFTAKCVNEGCIWRIHASKKNGSTAFFIKNYQPMHTCQKTVRTSESTVLNTKVVTSLYLEKIQQHPNFKAKDIKSDFKSTYGFNIPYHMAWRGKEKALKNVVGEETNSYNRCCLYLQELLKQNPTSYVQIEADPETLRFERVFICYGGTIQGFKYCRPLLFLDGTFLKGVYKGAMLCATGKTGNDDFYPYAFCICSAENDDNWCWFLEHLANILLPQNREITFISDRHSGILKGVPHYFQHYGHHSFCRNHLKKNLATTYLNKMDKQEREDILKVFQECMYAPTETLFEHLMNQLREIGGTRIEEFLRDIPYRNWASAFFTGKRYREFDNNVAESFNMWIINERAMPIYQLVDQLTSRLMNYNGEHLLQSTKWSTVLCKSREEWLQHMCLKGSVYDVQLCVHPIYEVRHGGDTHRVDLQQKTCTCQQWQQRGFLCSHACAAISKSRTNIYDYVEKYFTKEYYQKAYETPIIPSTNIEEPIAAFQAVEIRPPLTRKPPGRPPTARKKSITERKHNRCSRCGQCAPHNRKTCKEPISNG